MGRVKEELLHMQENALDMEAIKFAKWFGEHNLDIWLDVQVQDGRDYEEAKKEYLLAMEPKGSA
tara:strand:- start:432 stop:623 length:192 start_codon:yes stop_codon:yes gene_type:complete